MTRRRASAAAMCALLALPARAQELRLPGREGSLRFAVIGDTGTASRGQYEVGRQMEAFRARFPFELVLMTGDNIYGADRPRDFRRKFELPYEALLAAGVKFYAALGNHDNPARQRLYKPFHMDGRRYYSFRPREGVRFFALDSTSMDAAQLRWLDEELAAAGSDWKVCFFHHPLYSSARRHGSTVRLRRRLEPVLGRHKVDVVFSGHDHTYERIKPQQGIHYFVTGAGGSLRRGNLRPAGFTAAGFDQDFHFVLAELDGGALHFQAVSRIGSVVDAGVIRRGGGSAAGQ
jgi:hypothetical protein